MAVILSSCFQAEQTHPSYSSSVMYISPQPPWYPPPGSLQFVNLPLCPLDTVSRLGHNSVEKRENYPVSW